MKPYTYTVIHNISKKKYYGSRYSKTCNPKDLGVSYFTSSKLIKALIRKEGKEAFTFKVRRRFNSAQEARKWECKFLNRVKAAEKEDWYNQSYGNGNFMCNGHSKHTCEKMSLSHTGRKHSEETKRKISEGNKCKIMPPISEETRAKLKLRRIGYKHSQRTKDKISKSHCGRVYPSFSEERKEIYRSLFLGAKTRSMENTIPKSPNIKCQKILKIEK